VWQRDFFDAEIVGCPDEAVVGKSFGQVGLDRGGLHPVDAFLDLVLEHGTALRWRTTISNHRPEVLKKLARDPGIQMGFSDAGAHLRNMAFYNFSLRLLKRVRDAERAGRPFLSTQRAVHRLTAEVAEWFGLDAGTLREGERADFVVINPEHLDESVNAYHEATVPFYGGLSRMVNRNDATVVATAVNGTVVFRDGDFCEGYGTTVKSGRFLRAGAAEPAKALV
jgi:N-acyl-D-aspartate/D-glutamate deacylase